MKKIIAAVLVFILAVSLISCGKDEKKLTEFEKVVGDINKLSADFDEALTILAEGSTVYTSEKNSEAHKGFVAYGNYVLLYGTETVTEIGGATVTEKGVYLFEVTKLVPLMAEVTLKAAVKQMSIDGSDLDGARSALITAEKEKGAEGQKLDLLTKYINGEKLVIDSASPLWRDTLYSENTEVSVNFDNGRYNFTILDGVREHKESEHFDNGSVSTEKVYEKHADGISYLSAVYEYYEEGGRKKDTTFHEDGQIKTVSEYPAGWPVASKVMEYYEDGLLKRELTRRMPDGKEFDQKTVMTESTAYYQSGQKSSETYYDENGSIVAYTYDEDGNKLSYSIKLVDQSYIDEEYYTNGHVKQRAVYGVSGYATSLEEFYENGYIKNYTDYHDQSSSIKSYTVYSSLTENFILERTEYYHMDITIVEVELFPKSYVIYEEGWNHPKEEYTFYTDGTQQSLTVRYENGQIKDQYEFLAGGKLSLKKTWSAEGELLVHEEYYKSGTLKYHMGLSEDENGNGYQFVINYGEDGAELDITHNYENGEVKYYEFHANGNPAYFSHRDADGNLVNEVRYNENGEKIE